MLLCCSLPTQAFERIVSMNLCTDQLLYLLEDAGHIRSVSFLGVDPDYSWLSKELAAFPVNNGQAEELIKYQPDLILAGSYSDKHAVQLLRELGYRVELINIPQDVSRMEDSIAHLGNLLGRKSEAEAIIANMRQRRSAAMARVAGKPRPLAVILAPDGYTHGRHSMNGDLLEMAGYRNLAAETGIEGSSNITLEHLLQAQPDFLIIEDASPNRNSLSQRLLQHNALQSGLPKTRQIHVHPNLWTCGGPSMIDALEILVEAHP